MHNDHDRGDHNLEHTDMHLKLVLVSGVALTITVFLSFVAGVVIMKGFDARPAFTEYQESPLAREHPESVSTKVLLQPNPGRSFDAFEVQQDKLVNDYAVVSEQPPVYRIPVEKAIEIIAQNGFPKFVPMGTSTPAPAAATPPTEHQPGDAPAPQPSGPASAQH